MKDLDEIPGGSGYDREFINKYFVAVFPEKYLKKLIERKWDRKQVFDEIRDSNNNS